MMKFLEPIYRYWRAPFIGTDLCRGSNLSVVINPLLDADEKVTILHTVDDGHTAIALRPDVAHSLSNLGILDAACSEAVVREGLQQIGILMHPADNLFYLPFDARDALMAEVDSVNVRSLHAGDAALFSDFRYRSNQEDLDAAQVDLEDWAVFGAMGEDGRLVSIASTYPWDDVPLADIGVQTLESARGNGYATQLLFAAARHAMTHGYELQYRCQLDNKASIGLAQSAGLLLFGRWEIPSPNSAACVVQTAS